MGADSNCLQVFAGSSARGTVRKAIISALREHLGRRGYKRVRGESAAERALSVGPEERWIWIGDSAGTLQLLDTKEVLAMIRMLSRHWPVVEISVSDTAAIALSLYRGGRRVDHFANLQFPFLAFSSPEAAAQQAGDPQLWADLLLDPRRAGDLRQVWRQGVDNSHVRDIVVGSAELFGWRESLVEVGFTYDSEGIPERYDWYLEDLSRSDFSEFFFRKSPRKPPFKASIAGLW